MGDMKLRHGLAALVNACTSPLEEVQVDAHKNANAPPFCSYVYLGRAFSYYFLTLDYFSDFPDT